MPDLRGRVVAGKDDMGGVPAGRLNNAAKHGVTGTTLGSAGGSEVHQLTVGEIPSHAHSYTSPTGAGCQSPATGPGCTTFSNVALSTGSAGGDDTHTNVQPTMVLNYIIKT